MILGATILCAILVIIIIVRRSIRQWKAWRMRRLAKPNAQYMLELENRQKADIQNERNERRQRAVDNIYVDVP